MMTEGIHPFAYYRQTYKAKQFRSITCFVYNSEHRKMRAKQQHVCKEMNQYIRSIPTGSGF